MTERGLQWDDELERLSTSVVETFGDQALNDAITRAYGHAVALVRTAGTRPAPTAFEDCVRVELRRLLRPH